MINETDEKKAMPLTKIATCLWRDVRGVLHQVYKIEKNLLCKYSNEITKLRDSHQITEREAKMFLVDSVPKEADVVPAVETIAQPPTQDHTPADKYMQILVEIRDLLKVISQTRST
jgi:hypothetical protein